MGNTAEKTTIEKDSLETDIANDDEDITKINTSDEENETTEEEIEIVREGSQPKKTETFGSIRNRVNKLNAKVASANDTASVATDELALVTEQNKLLKLRLEQTAETPQQLAPNPDDFDEGANDSGYLKKQGEYTQSIIQKEVSRQVSEIKKQNENTQRVNHQAVDLESKQFEHYQRVNDLKVKNYIEREDKAIEILGKEIFNEIVKNYSDSENVLYYLGTDANRKEAESLASLTKSNPVLGISELGALRKDLKVKPKNKTTLDPDGEVKGSASSNKKQRGPEGVKYS